MVTTGSLGVFFIILILILAANRTLLPGIMFTGSFILFALWLTGLIDTSIQLFSASGNVNSNCQTYVSGSSVRGDSLTTLAWMTLSTICEFLLSFFRYLVLMEGGFWFC